jgi:hypothetical protein
LRSGSRSGRTAAAGFIFVVTFMGSPRSWAEETLD